VIDYRAQEFIDDHERSHIGRGIVSFRNDSRNRSIFPSQGGERNISWELAAGDYSYHLARANMSRYFPLGEKTTLKLYGGVDYGDGIGSTEDLPFFERFYAGGVSTVRGFDSSSLGPRERCKREPTDEDSRSVVPCASADPIGGTFRVLGRSEVYLPIFGTADSADKRFLVFADIGNVFEDVDAFESSELRGSTGFGFTWLSPIGPLNISRAIALKKKSGDDEDLLQITLGTFLD